MIINAKLSLVTNGAILSVSVIMVWYIGLWGRSKDQFGHTFWFSTYARGADDDFSRNYLYKNQNHIKTHRLDSAHYISHLPSEQWILYSSLYSIPSTSKNNSTCLLLESTSSSLTLLMQHGTNISLPSVRFKNLQLSHLLFFGVKFSKIIYLKK